MECDRASFQDLKLLHKAAQREFGPMTAGIVGLNESQIETLENVVRDLRKNQPLFDALVKSFVLGGIGLHPVLRKKYGTKINPADQGQAGAFILEKEPVSERYAMSEEAHRYLVLLIRHQDLLHHMIRGEFSFYALEDVVSPKDKDLFDAIFLSSFIKFNALGENTIIEELATRLFQFRSLCHRIIAQETKSEQHLDEVFVAKGHLFKALEAFDSDGTPEGCPSSGNLESFEWLESERGNYREAGMMIYALERVFRLRGVRYVEFADLAHFMVKVPLRYIYRKRRHFGIGYGTFERELFEAQRIYRGLQALPERARHFILRHLVTDEVRIFGFEKVSAFLNYENQMRILWLALFGTLKLKKSETPICLDFLGLAKIIEKRYEAVNDFLSTLPSETMWRKDFDIDPLFGAETGLVLRKKEDLRVLSIEFVDPMDISRKSAYMKSISDEGQLKSYFHYTLRSLREHPFFTDDYERELETAFEKRLEEIVDQMLDQIKRQIEPIEGVLGDTKHHQRPDEPLPGHRFHGRAKAPPERSLRAEKGRAQAREDSEEIEGFLKTIRGVHELRDYWDSIKWYLSGNRDYLGKDFEILVARRFDEAMRRVQGSKKVC